MSADASAPVRPQARSLPPVAAHIDETLARLDAQLDWLLALSPLDGEALWSEFDAAGRKSEPQLRYIDLDTDLDAARRTLDALPLTQVEPPALQALLAEKQLELRRMIDLVRERDRPGFVDASIALFGGVEPELLDVAGRILDDVPVSEPLAADAGIDEVRAAVEAEIDWYRAQAPGFHIDVVVDTDISSMLMVSHGTFYIDGNIRLPRARVDPLIQHEIGTHVVTRHNGQQQALRQLQVGLAQYDPTQEGLGVLAEYLAGFLPGERLRVLAARVVAAAMAADGAGLPAIFERLHAGHGLPTDDAFDVALRARRGGGLTKDAVYLRGVRDLLAYLAAGGEFDALFLGKFALSQLDLLESLVDDGWVVPPALLPRYTAGDDFPARLDACRRTPVEHLHQIHRPPEATA
ncbi:tyrosine/phenylalanine carboxypeptidase domain-containing protein [Luteimonas sp. FCS-9]|uniref:tyrosine/phenylalanine carboxypeptidase domain-containing protein n=1 Tax=Luteimonas sp. FCS-9 TaxID=1547516 RepID=UPI000ABC452B|nr:tyrosine/phenylalanine carboxypeptidase domain-containing protein [Luteimonas sp. FCS-9]